MSVGRWRVAAASVIGQAHLNQNTNCQDRLLTRSIETANDGEILVAAVADGAGSTTSGQRGAETACEFFVEQAAEFLKIAPVESFSKEFGKRWIAFFQQQIAEKARLEKKEMREFATTFIGAIAGRKCAAFYQVGDGGAVFSVDGKPGSYQFAVPPIEAEYVNQTEFLTDDAAAESLRFVRLDAAIEDLILFSDGVFSVAVDYQNNKPHEPFLMPMIAPLRNGANGGTLLNEKLEKFLASPRINEKTDDDKTIILASRRISE